MGLGFYGPGLERFVEEDHCNGHFGSGRCSLGILMSRVLCGGLMLCAETPKAMYKSGCRGMVWSSSSENKMSGWGSKKGV